MASIYEIFGFDQTWRYSSNTGFQDSTRPLIRTSDTQLQHLIALDVANYLTVTRDLFQLKGLDGEPLWSLNDFDLNGLELPSTQQTSVSKLSAKQLANLNAKLTLIDMVAHRVFMTLLAEYPLDAKVHEPRCEEWPDFVQYLQTDESGYKSLNDAAFGRFKIDPNIGRKGDKSF